MDNKYGFFNGQRLKAIYWEEGAQCVVGESDCIGIEVVMENGQMAGVPWAVVFREDGKCQKYNLALAEGVELALKG